MNKKEDKRFLQKKKNDQDWLSIKHQAYTSSAQYSYNSCIHKMMFILEKEQGKPVGKGQKYPLSKPIEVRKQNKEELHNQLIDTFKNKFYNKNTIVYKKFSDSIQNLKQIKDNISNLDHDQLEKARKLAAEVNDYLDNHFS